MAWVFMENRLGQSRVGDVDTEEMVPVGTILRAYDPDYGAGEFIYLQGVASTASGDWVVYNADDFSTTRASANAIGPVAVATAATVANTWGWYQIQGKAVGNAASDIADDAAVYLTSTAGRVDDAVVAGDRVKGAKSASTATSNLADFEISRPFVDDIAD